MTGLATGGPFSPCVRCGIRLNIGKGQITVSFTPDDLAGLIRDTSDANMQDRLLCAMGVLAPETERALRVELADPGGSRTYSQAPLGEAGSIQLEVFAASVPLEDGAVLELRDKVEGGLATVGGVTIPLGEHEFGLLRVLVRKRNVCTTWFEIAEAFGWDKDEAYENVRELVHRTRGKLKALGVTGLIESRRNEGYKLCEVSEASDVSDA